MPQSPRTPSTNGRERFAWVADVGGSHVTAAVIEIGDERRILARESAEIQPQGNAGQILGSLAVAMRAVAPDAPRWTIALPGPFDYQRGIGTFEGVAKFSALAGVNMRTSLGCLLGVAETDLRFVNDAIAYGIGEWSLSKRRPARFVCVTLGTGIGSAFLDQGKPVESGPDVPSCGWVHLLALRGAPLEDTVSTRAIQRRYEREGGERCSVQQIAERARAGEPRANAVLEFAMSGLGTALAPWIARFDASEIVVGGSMARSWDVFGAALAGAVVAGVGESVTVRPTRLFDDAPLIGAALLD